MRPGVLRRSPGLAPFLVSRFLYVLGAAGAPVLLTLTTLDGGGALSSLALVLGAGALPAVLGALVSKRLSDRLTLRGLLVWCTILWAVVALVTGLLRRHGTLPLGWLCAVSFTVELCAALQYPVLGSLLPTMVDPADLEQANSGRSLVVGVAGIAGPTVFAVALSLWSVSTAWLLLAVTLVCSLLPLRRVPRGERLATAEAGVWGELRSGWSFFWSSRGLRLVVVASGVWHFFGWSLLSVAGPVLLQDRRGSAEAWGWLQSGIAAGSLVGALVAGRWRPARVARWALLSLCPALLLALALSFDPSLPTLLALSALTGAALSAGGVVWTSAVQREVPADRLGQVFGYDYLFSEALNPLGLLLVPLLVTIGGGEAAALRSASVTLLVLLALVAVVAPRRLAA